MNHLWFLESFRRKTTYIEAYLEYESQSQGIKSQPLPKQRKIVVVRLHRTTKVQYPQYLARSQRQRSHICS